MPDYPRYYIRPGRIVIVLEAGPGWYHMIYPALEKGDITTTYIRDLKETWGIVESNFWRYKRFYPDIEVEI